MRRSLRNTLIGAGILVAALGTKSIIENLHTPQYEFNANIGRTLEGNQDYMPSFSLESNDVGEDDFLNYSVQVDCYNNGKIIPELRSRYPGNIVATGYFSRGEVLMAHAVHPSIIGLNRDRIQLDSIDEVILSFHARSFDKQINPKGFPESVRIKVTPEVLVQYSNDWNEYESYLYYQAQKRAEESGVSSGRF